MREIGSSISEAHDDLSPNRTGGGVYTIINSHDSGLDDNQRNVLTASLNGVQKAWMSFADTVATVFGVDTKQAA